VHNVQRVNGHILELHEWGGGSSENFRVVSEIQQAVLLPFLQLHVYISPAT